MNPDDIKQEVSHLITMMGFGADIESLDVHHGTAMRVSLRVRGKANLLIGERGNNLIAIEHILKKIIDQKKEGEETRFTFDINDYRMRRLEDLKQDVKQAAREVRLYHRESPLRPMSSFERRIVHLLLAEYPDITTTSIGADPERRVVIKPYP